MPNAMPSRAHVITGGFPPGQPAGHDHDYARLRLLQFLAEMEVPASVGNDFSDVGKWLDRSRLLITYTAGPFPDEDQNRAIRDWLVNGGHWLGLHGTSGGRAVRVGESGRRRAMLKGSFHETLGGFFINHPPVRKFTVDVSERPHPLTKDLPPSFEIVDELYMIEVQDPAASEVVLTTASVGADPSPPGFGFVYDKDTSLQADGKTRVLGYTREVGEGGVAYIAPGHCHTPATNSQPFVDVSVDPEGKTPPVLRGPWETAAYATLLRNAIRWGMG
ncbi:MAG: ThuA domain-containing protein [Chloroflexi bacterium]|nr:ThuA domain-containing protein [Chloroflexota bacterium]